MQSRTERKRAEKNQVRKWRSNWLFYTIIAVVLASCAIYLIALAAEDSGTEGQSFLTPPPAGAAASPTPSAASAAGSPSQTPSPSTSSSPTPTPGQTGGSQAVTLHFAGDVMLGARVGEQMQMRGYDYPYQHVQEMLSTADLTIVNLETAVTEAGEEQTKQYVYRSSPEALPALKQSGVDIVNLANNHSMDYGVPGLLDTFKHLDEAGIPYVGAGVNSTEAYKPHIVEINGIKIAVLGLTRVYQEAWWQAGKEPGVAGTYEYKVPQALEAVRTAKAAADLVVVIAHWGVERKETPEPYQTDLARKYIDEGADLVIGGHPHVVQGFETYKGKWIAYSLGNFIFTVNPNPLTWNSMIVRATCTGSGDCNLNVVPVSAGRVGEPVPLTGEEGSRLLERISALSPNARVEENGDVFPDVVKPVLSPPPMPGVPSPTATASPTAKPTVKPTPKATAKPSASPAKSASPASAKPGA